MGIDEFIDSVADYTRHISKYNQEVVPLLVGTENYVNLNVYQYNGLTNEGSEFIEYLKLLPEAKRIIFVSLLLNDVNLSLHKVVLYEILNTGSSLEAKTVSFGSYASRSQSNARSHVNLILAALNVGKRTKLNVICFSRREVESKLKTYLRKYVTPLNKDKFSLVCELRDDDRLLHGRLDHVRNCVCRDKNQCSELFCNDAASNVQCSLNCLNEQCTNNKVRKCECFEDFIVINEEVHSMVKIPPHTLIGEYVGTVLTLEKARKEKVSHFVRVPRSDIVIDATRSGNFTRFIKHDDNANVNLIEYNVDGNTRIAFKSGNSPIEPNEVLTSSVINKLE